MPSRISSVDDLRNVAASAAAKGSWSSLDYSCFGTVGVLADYMQDVQGFTIGGLTVAALDPAKDDAKDAKATKARNSLRLRLLANLQRNARNAHDNDDLQLRCYFADIAAPTKDDANRIARAFVVTRTK